jgi:hypothetical protein
MTRPSTARTLVALLLVVCAVAFVIGVSRERSAEGKTESHRDAVPTATTGETTAPRSEVGEAGETAGEHDEEAAAREAAERKGGNGTAEETQSEAAEGAGAHAGENRDILGIDPESTGAVVAAVAVSLLLAAAVWFWPSPAILSAVLAFGLLVAAFDVREAFHQADESRSALVALALLIAALHVGVAIAAGAALREQQGDRTSPAPV